MKKLKQPSSKLMNVIKKYGLFWELRETKKGYIVCLSIDKRVGKTLKYKPFKEIEVEKIRWPAPGLMITGSLSEKDLNIDSYFIKYVLQR